MKVMVMAGTSDAVKIISKLAELEDIEVIATTTTKYGGDLAVTAGANEIIVGRMGIHEIEDLITVNEIDILIDATHPFAVDASLNAVKSAKSSGIMYIRFERPSIEIPGHEQVFEVSSFEEAAKKAIEIVKENVNCRVMHFAGVSTLHYMIKWINPQFMVARVLPVVYSLKKCLEMGIPSENIIAMQGTFSKKFNMALMQEYGVGVAVTKESGETGGTSTKIAAAIDLEIPIIIVKRPVVNEIKNEITFTDVVDVLNHIQHQNL